MSIVGTAGWRLYEYATAGSTNDLARGLPAWSAVRADVQTGGRGRFGRVFVSDPGGLWISAVLPSEGGPQRWAGFSLMVGIHLVRMLESLSVPGARLRWPNDLMSGPKKLGGLLIEQSSSETLVVGFGLNVRNSPWATDPALETISTSLARACGLEATGGTGVPPVLEERMGRMPMTLVGAALDGPPSIPPLPEIFEITVRTLDALADAHQEMQVTGMAAAIRELNRRWREPVPVRIALSGGDQVFGLFTGLDPHGNIRLLDDTDCEFLVPHQSIEKLFEIGYPA